jgi:hypothetical protein
MTFDNFVGEGRVTMYLWDFGLYRYSLETSTPAIPALRYWRIQHGDVLCLPGEESMLGWAAYCLGAGLRDRQA